MDAATFTVQMVRTLAWPAVVGFVFWNVRGHVGSLIANIRQLRWKEAEVTFGKELDRVEDELPPPVEAIGRLEVQELAAEAQLPPAYIVQQAWLRVERALNEPLTKKGIKTGPVAHLISRPDLPLTSAERKTLEELRVLRNRAVHDVEPDISVTDALRYRALAETLARRIEDNSRLGAPGC